MKYRKSAPVREPKSPVFAGKTERSGQMGEYPPAGICRSSPALAPPLSRNQSLVLETLRQSSRPLTAYEILDVLHPAGFRAPSTVYRALEGLQERALVHRLESMKAFVACDRQDHSFKNTIVFAICDSCSIVSEIVDPILARQVEQLTQRSHFALGHSTIELHGCCSSCQDGEN